MSWKIGAVLLLSFLIAASGIFVGGKLSGNDAPSPEFLAQALVNQDESCGRSLDLTYTIGYTDEPVPARCRYVRTPQRSFLSMADEKRTKRISLDAGTKISRQLTIHADGKEATGVIDDKFAADLGNREFPDVVRFPLDVSTLTALVRRGTVSPERQDIDGKACWLVETPSNYTKDQTLGMWLDPDIGFCPRRVEMRGPREIDLETIDFQEYKELGNGVYSPMEIHIRFANKVKTTGMPPVGSMLECVMRVSKAQIDQPIPDSELAVDFPSGTLVYDKVKDMKYTQP